MVGFHDVSYLLSFNASLFIQPAPRTFTEVELRVLLRGWARRALAE